MGELSLRKSYYPGLPQQGALRQGEARLRSILLALPVMQFVIGQDPRVISWNRILETYSGIWAEDLLGTDGQWRADEKASRSGKPRNLPSFPKE